MVNQLEGPLTSNNPKDALHDSLLLADRHAQIERMNSLSDEELTDLSTYEVIDSVTIYSGVAAETRLVRKLSPLATIAKQILAGRKKENATMDAEVEAVREKASVLLTDPSNPLNW